jgi:hypothetical protein
MTAVLERDETASQAQAVTEALKAYFHAISAFASPADDLELTKTDVALDFILRVESGRMSESRKRLANIEFDIRNRYGLQITTAVLPK